MIAIAMAMILVAAPVQASHDYPVAAAPQVTSQTLELGAAPEIGVDNVNGDITVVADGGSQVRFTATERIRAKSDEALKRAQKEVKLEVTPGSGKLTLYVDGPFRGKHGWFWDHEGSGYEVSYTFELHVPKGAQLDLRTVNGDEKVSGTAGAFHVGTVNGGVDLEKMAGAGKASTVNGPVKVVYTDNPKDDSSFGTVNGKVSLYLQAGLNADVRYSTVSGAVYTDFAGDESVADRSSGRERGMRVWHSGRSRTIAIGQGGPQIKVSTVNGDVFLHEVK